MNSHYALVTGASSGIGAEIARQLAQKGFPVIITARRGDRLAALKKRIEQESRVDVKIIESDLAIPGGGIALFEKVKAAGLETEILVNNAGVGQQGEFIEMDFQEVNKMIRLNINALTELTGLFAKEFTHKKKGRILQVASLASFLPTPYVASYAATKAYVKSFSEALRYELKGTGVVLTTLYPGVTSTEFVSVAQGSVPKSLERSLLSAEKVAQAGIRGMMKGKRTVIPGFTNKVSAWFSKILPGKLLVNVAGNMMKKVS